MKRRRAFATAMLVVAVAAQDNNSTTDTSAKALKFTSTNAPACADDLARSLVALYGANRNVYDQCVVDAELYSLFPYSGLLPTDAQIIAMVSSLSCLYFFQALLQLPVAQRECNVGGLDLRSTLETLLMTSQDIVNNVAPLTCDQFIQFMTWRHIRNIAEETGQPYDAQSDSAVAFDRQVVDAAKRLHVTLTDQLVIKANGRSIGRASDAEIRSIESESPAPGSVEASKRDTSMMPTASSLAWRSRSLLRDFFGWILFCILGSLCLVI